MNRSLFKKVFVVMAIVFVLFQAFLIPISSAAWSGTPWKGEPWQGSPWEGDSWEGESWQGDFGTGADSNGGPQMGSPNSQSGNNVNPENNTPENNYLQPPYKIPNYLPGNTWQNSPAPGSTIPGMNGPGSNANPLAPGGNIPGQSNSPGQINNNPANLSEDNKDYGPAVWPTISFVGNNIVNGQVGFVAGVLEQGDNFKPSSVFGRPNFLTNIVMNGIKLGVGDGTSFDYAYDTYSAVDMGYGIYDVAQKYSNAVNITSAADTALDTAPTILNAGNAARPALGVLAKLNIASAGVSTAVSAVNTGISINNAIDTIKSDKETSAKVSAGADAVASIGTTLFNGGLTAAAIPGGQTAGMVLVGVGAGLFVIGKGVKYVADNWSRIKNSTIGKTVSNGWKGLRKMFGFGS